MIRLSLKLLKALNANANPAQLAGALALALIAGLTPLLSLHNLVVLLILCIIRINLSMFILSLFLFSGLAWLVDPWFNAIGTTLLTNESLTALWSGLYQSNFWRISHFNNSLTLGSFIVALALSLPAYILCHWAIRQYRQRFMDWLSKSPAVRVLKASKLFQQALRIYNFTETS
ncbi:MAG: hypothetical protein ACI93R_000911 [Flavobacteriales bacterium]|jgi:uncharacterized protein (TIGR03546 family)